MPEVTRIQILDRQLASSPERYLRLETLRVRNHHADGSASRTYACDLVLAPGVDAVAVILFCREGDAVRVAVVECVRPAVSLRRELDLAVPDEREYLTVTEVVAGRFEEGDRGEEGADRRAAIEAREEAGFHVRPQDAIRLGRGLFSSPGQTSEKVFFRAFQVEPRQRQEAAGDGSPMEEAGTLRFIELGQAIRLCVDGEIEDPKAEVGFRRLADHLKYQAPQA
ncbi:MAG: NUDIX hydrolase [Candidatus Brocadiia bacterium]